MLQMTALIFSFTSECAHVTKKAWPVVKMLLVLSLGQASVKRGFSINKEVVVENQHVESLVARKLIKDHIHLVKGVENVDISCSMIVSVRAARGT